MLMADKINRLTHEIIGAGMRIHGRVGSGLLESVYQRCFAWELKDRQMRFVARPGPEFQRRDDEGGNYASGE
jgi:GxxExxY protein